MSLVQPFLVCMVLVACRTVEESWIKDVPNDGTATMTRSFYYPGTTSLVARGTTVNGTPNGQWLYYFADGSRLAQGQFGPTGELDGKWVLFNTTGAVSTLLNETRCIDLALMSGRPGSFDFEWDRFDEPQLEALSTVLPFRKTGWRGTGVYANGRRLRAMTREEIAEHTERVGQ